MVIDYGYVTVSCGNDYSAPPVTGGTDLTPADSVTNPARWSVLTGTDFDSTQPVPVVEDDGLRFAWTIDPGKSAFQGVEVTLLAGHTYTLALAVEAPLGAARWCASAPGVATSEWITPEGGARAATVRITPTVTGPVRWGINVSEPTSSTHLVTAIGVWDNADRDVSWTLLPLDPCTIALPVEIKHGRSGISAQPDAPECTFTYLGQIFPGALGDPMSVAITRPQEDGLTWTDPRADWTSTGWGWTGSLERSKRFVGTIAGLTAIEKEGQVWAYDVVVTGVLADLGYLPIDITRPRESDVDRVTAISEACGVSINIRGGGGIELVADAIQRDALDALHEVCKTSGGLVWQARDGGIWYGTAEHRDSDASVVLPCTIVLDEVAWENDLELVLNHVTVKWPENGVERQITHRDDESIAQWGLRHVDVTTRCADQQEAQRLGLLVLARRAQPYWRMSEAVVDFNLASVAERRMLMDMDVSDGVLLPIPIVPMPVPAEVNQWTLEGWVETLGSDAHLLQIAITDRNRWTAARLRDWEGVATEPWQKWVAGSWLNQMVEFISVPPQGARTPTEDRRAR